MQATNHKSNVGEFDSRRQVGSSVLTRVLQNLAVGSRDDVVLGLDSPDDAAVIRSPGPDYVTVHTVDFFRSFLSDPFVFGQVAANHALSDCHAMNAEPRTALAIAVVPYGSESKVSTGTWSWGDIQTGGS